MPEVLLTQKIVDHTGQPVKGKLGSYSESVSLQDTHKFTSQQVF